MTTPSPSQPARPMRAATASLPDLADEQQIHAMVSAFYARVREDDLLAPVFVEQAQVDWDAHIAQLTAFWCAIAFAKPGFHGEPTKKHSALSEAIPFRSEQFQRWVEVFHDTIEGGWAGPHAEAIKARGTSIAKIQSRVVRQAQPWG